jgi:hypothetical protein
MAIKQLHVSGSRKHSEEKGLPAFRSEVRSKIVGATTLKSSDLTGLRGDCVKVSEFRLEQYLNACNPTCHG